MPNQLNQLIAKELGDRFPKGTSFIIVGYNKLTGPETQTMRQTLRGQKIHMEVVKNTVAARVLESNGAGAGNKFLQGPCAIITGEGELPEVAKVLTELTKKVENRLFVRGGVMDNVAFGPEGITVLASIPPKPVLHARFAGSVQAPIARMAGAFQSIVRSLACALDGIRRQKESSAPPATPPPAASEPAPSPAA